MKLTFTDANYPFSFEVTLKPNFSKIDEEISTASGESGWIERVLKVSSISSNAARRRSRNSGGREAKGTYAESGLA